MSILSVSYRDLDRASSDAKKVAKRIGDYSDSLQRDVVKKLNSYNGTWTVYLNSARNQTEQKIDELNEEKELYEKLSNNLDDLREECKSTDVAVKGLVSSLTASFRETHGIRNHPIENAIINFLTTVQNCTYVTRWIDSKVEDFMDKANDLKDRIKYWYNYAGGKQDLSAKLTFLLELGISVCCFWGAIATFAAATLTLGTVLVFLASMTLATISFIDCIYNLRNEGRASSIRGNDPATAKRLSDLNTAADTLRSSFMFGTSGEYYKYDETYNNYANGLTIAKFVADIVKFVDGGHKLLTNVGKWLTRCETFKLSSLLSKSGLKEFLKASSQTFNEIKVTIKMGFSDLFKLSKIDIRQVLYIMRSNFQEIKIDMIKNLKNEFFDFSDVKSTSSSLKQIFSFGKDIVGMFDKGQFDIGKFYEDIIGPAIGFADIPNAEGEHKMITIGDFSSKIIKFNKMLKVPSSFNKSTIDMASLETIYTHSKVDVSFQTFKIFSYSY